MSMKSDVARLERAGNQYSGYWEKLRHTLDNLAKFLMTVFPECSLAISDLPRGYSFWHDTLGDYRIEIPCSDEDSVVLMSDSKPRDAMLIFADDVANGWLNELSEYLETESSRLKRVCDAVKQFLGAHESSQPPAV